jgi:hypothetical protein
MVLPALAEWFVRKARTMAVHTISLGGAMLVLLLAVLFLYLLGPVSLLLLILVAVLLWYAFGPGTRQIVVTT